MQNHGNCSAEASGASRRQFLTTGAATIATLALPELLGRPAAAAVRTLTGAGSLPGIVSGNKSLLFVYLPGGPSQLDMYDMKPDAPAEIRGEFRPINTNVPGMRVCEHLPLHAKIADKFAVVHGVETLDTHSRAAVTTGYGADKGRPCLIDGLILPYVGQKGGAVSEQESLLDWDMHGQVLGREASIFDELRQKLPVYDHMIHRLITSMYDTGADKDSLIVVCGEFGRTPWINEHGGRNHWATSGSVLFAGGGLKMGQMIGDTGPIGERDQAHQRPYTAQNLMATIYRHLGIDPAMQIETTDGRRVPLLDDTRPIAELI